MRIEGVGFRIRIRIRKRRKKEGGKRKTARRAVKKSARGEAPGNGERVVSPGGVKEPASGIF